MHNNQSNNASLAGMHSERCLRDADRCRVSLAAVAQRRGHY